MVADQDRGRRAKTASPPDAGSGTSRAGASLGTSRAGSASGASRAGADSAASRAGAGPAASRPAGSATRLTHAQREWSEQARTLIRRAGHRRGGARDMLIELFAREDCALTVQEIDRRLSGWLQEGFVHRPVGIASVYRGVEVLQDLRLIARVDVGDGLARYERAALERSDHHHHHFVCDKCGLLVPFDDAALEQAIDALEARFGFKAEEHEVVLRGSCLQCR